MPLVLVPLDQSTVPWLFVVEASGVDGVWEVHVIASVAEGEDFLDRLVGGTDLGFACGAASTFLANCFPRDGAASAHDEVAAHGAALEKFNLFTVWHRAANLAAPVGVAETLYLGDGWRRGGVRVGFAVVGWRVVKVG